MTPTETTRLQGTLAAVLTLLAGYIDAYTLLNYQVYASFMSGNTTQTGLNAGEGRLGEAGHNLLPIPLFVMGIFVGAFLLQRGLRHPLRRLCGLVAFLLAIGFAAAFRELLPNWFSIIVLSLAMGIMNTTITHVGGQAVSLGFVTGDLSHLGRHLALAARRAPVSDPLASWDTHWWRAALLLRVWACFLAGALLSGAMMLVIGEWILLPPIFILLVLSAWDCGNRALST